MAVLIDSGFRRGTDVPKPSARGAGFTGSRCCNSTRTRALRSGSRILSCQAQAGPGFTVLMVRKPVPRRSGAAHGAGGQDIPEAWRDARDSGGPVLRAQ